MTSILAIRDFIKWYFSYIPFVTTDPAAIDKHFTGYNYGEFDAIVRKETSEVYIALRKNKTAPLSGIIRENGTSQQELLYIDIFCVQTVGSEDWRGQEQAQQDCKQAIGDFEQWIYQTVRGANRCDYPIVKYIDLANMPQGAVENFGTCGAFGWYLRLNFNEWLPSDVSFTTPPAGPFPVAVPHGSLYYFDSTANKILPLEQGEEGQILVSQGGDEKPQWKNAGKRVLLTDASFTDNEYVNPLLVGLVPQIDFNLFTNEGTGGLLLYGDGYSFDDSTGTIGAPAQKYLLEIY